MEPAIKDFHHPYNPYDIQIELMNVIYECIAERKIGILESPTGMQLLPSSDDRSDVESQELYVSFIHSRHLLLAAMLVPLCSALLWFLNCLLFHIFPSHVLTGW